MIPTTADEFFNPDFTANPYPTYAELRRSAPVHRIAMPHGQGLWLITRYEDALAALKDPRFVKDRRQALLPAQVAQMPSLPPAAQLLFENMLSLDPPDHTRLKTLVHKAFAPRLIQQLQPRIREIADFLLDQVAPAGQMDLINDYAFPLSVTVIAELLGVPSADTLNFQRWSRAIVMVGARPNHFAEIAPALQEFAEYLAALVAQRQAIPQDDLVSALVQVEESGDRLSSQELLSMLFLLLIAGHETSVNLISNGMLALLQHPDQRQLLHDNPDLIQTAIEEILRYNSPLETSTLRYAREDVEFGGAVIPRGEQVRIVIAAANHDPQHFADPTRLDLTRAPQQHLAFGYGIHYCLGAPLARLEGAIALSTLLRRLPQLRLAVPEAALEWRPGGLIRGLAQFPVAF